MEGLKCWILPKSQGISFSPMFLKCLRRGTELRWVNEPNFGCEKMIFQKKISCSFRFNFWPIITFIHDSKPLQLSSSLWCFIQCSKETWSPQDFWLTMSRTCFSSYFPSKKICFPFFHSLMGAIIKNAFRQPFGENYWLWFLYLEEFLFISYGENVSIVPDAL